MTTLTSSSRTGSRAAPRALTASRDSAGLSGSREREGRVGGRDCREKDRGHLGRERRPGGFRRRRFLLRRRADARSAGRHRSSSSRMAQQPFSLPGAAFPGMGQSLPGAGQAPAQHGGSIARRDLEQSIAAVPQPGLRQSMLEVLSQMQQQGQGDFRSLQGAPPSPCPRRGRSPACSTARRRERSSPAQTCRPQRGRAQPRPEPRPGLALASACVSDPSHARGLASLPPPPPPPPPRAGTALAPLAELQLDSSGGLALPAAASPALSSLLTELAASSHIGDEIPPFDAPDGAPAPLPRANRRSPLPPPQNPNSVVP